MKMRVRFFNGEVYDFPEVREETIVIDEKLISFVFRGGHVASIALRSFLFVEEMPDDEISEQVTQPVEDDVPDVRELINTPEEDYDYENSGIPRETVKVVEQAAEAIVRKMKGGKNVEEENSK